MNKKLLMGLCGAAAFASSVLWAGNPEQSHSTNMRSSRSSGPVIPMVSPEHNPFFQTLQPFSTNGLSISSPSRVMRTGEEQDPIIYGVVIAASSQTSYGIKQLPMHEGQDFTPVSGYGAYFNQVTSGTETDGIFYANNLVSRYGSLYCSYYSAIDISNWQRLAYTQSSDLIYSGRDMTTDPLTGDMYGCLIKTSSGANYVLARVEYQYSPGGQFTEYKREAICDLPEMLTALFFTPDGQLWGIDMVTDIDEESTATDKTYTKSASLYKIDKHTGKMTLIGDTGVKPYYVTSACCDLYGSGKVYWSVKTKENVGSLYTVDLTTGAATKVMDYPRNEEVVAMFVPMRTSPKSPADPTNVTADFPEGGLDGHINFDIPSTLNDGSEPTGNVDWQVTNNGSIIGSGSCAYGQHASCSFSAPQPGNYTFAVRLSNETGKSKRIQTSTYIGTGVPSTPVVNAAHVNGNVIVAWEPITGAAFDRGYIDVEAIRYDVVRYPDGAVVSKSQKHTSYTEAIDADAPFSYFTYGVTATIPSSDIRSAEGKSNMLVLGTIKPPFYETWDDTSLIGYGDNILSGVYPDYELDGSTLGHWYVHNMDKAATCSTGFGDENAWLMTPAIRFEEGKRYSLSFDTYCSFNNNPDKYARLKIMIGKGQNPDAMTTELFEEFTITALKANPEFKIADFTVPQTGTYYLGINCCTRNGGARVYIDNMAIEETAPTGFPGPCTAMTVKPETTGSLTAVISAIAPVSDTRQQPLQGTLKVHLLQNNEIIATSEDIAPGEAVSFRHTVKTGGESHYSITASNAIGTSRTINSSCYLGYYAPRPASEVKLTRNDADSDFTLEWTAPTQDVKWNALTANDITYKILGIDSQGETYVVVDSIGGNQHSLRFSDPKVNFNADQRFVYYGVLAQTNGGYATVIPSNALPVGTPYKTPYRESFHKTPAGIYSVQNGNSLGIWELLNDDTIDILSSQDNDNGYLGFFGNLWGTQGCFQTGLIDLDGLNTPGVTFYMYNIYQNNQFDDNEIFIAVNLGGYTSYMVKAEADQVGNYGKANKWTKYTASLEKFKGMKVSVMIVPTIKSYIWHFIDNFSISDLPAIDLSAGPVAGTPLIEEGQDGMYMFNIINNGYNKAGNITLDLMRNGKSVQTRTIQPIDAGSFAQITVIDRPDVDAEETSTYIGHVTSPGDADMSDNDSDPIETRIVLPPYPTVSNLQGSLIQTGVSLSWEQPDLNYKPNPRTETFESGKAWATSFDGWTFIDIDQKPINLGTANGQFGDIATGTTQSFFLMDVSQLDEQRQQSVHFQGHSGIRYLVKCAPGDINAQGDDWAITPELYGDAQTVTLWAHSHSSSAPENIEGLYSTGSINPEDFISAGKYIDVPQGWTMYSFELPEGAKRFAIRANSQATFLLQIDDVTFRPMPVQLTIAGYHIWRNGKRITTEPIKETHYTDNEGQEGDTYRVSPVYQNGEGIPCEPILIDNSGIDTANVETIKIRGGHNYISITGATGKYIEIFSADGYKIAGMEGSFFNTIPVGRGVYIVKTGAMTEKVIVK